MQDENKANTCMACSCPCETHKEHNHPVSAEGGSASSGEEKHEEVKACATCGQERKQDGTPACACK